MAQLKEKLEPYIKVTERIRTTSVNPVAGEDLIIGAVIVSDAGPSVPTLITSQTEFLDTYASKDITEGYINGLKDYYDQAPTMWANAYRLAGSCNLLVQRATKAKGVVYSVGIPDDGNKYIYRDGELLKKVSNFRLTIDDRDNTRGWSICVNGVGILGNYVDSEGPLYDYFIDSLPELVDTLNQTSKFFSPKYIFYDKNEDSKQKLGDEASTPSNLKAVKMVQFEEVYLGVDFLDKNASSRVDGGTMSDINEPAANTRAQGCVYLIPSDTTWKYNSDTFDGVIDLNDPTYSGFVAPRYHASNAFNSATTLKVRIRKFNHDAVRSVELAPQTELNDNGASPYEVLTNVLSVVDTKQDFFEVAILDPSLSGEVLFFNIGKITSYGDIELSELQEQLSMIDLDLPTDLNDLGLDYYTDGLVNITSEVVTEAETVESHESLNEVREQVTEKHLGVGDFYKIGEETTIYKITAITLQQLYADLTIKTTGNDRTSLLDVTTTDIIRAWDDITRDEVYITEGVTDLGCTDLAVQNALANIAVNENYFYPVSTVQSSNYLTIANQAAKIVQKSEKIYLSAPWDVDSGTLGFKVYISPATIYWEAVARNRRYNNEFAAVLGLNTGVVSYVNPITEFNKETRQKLLSRNINTVKWNNQSSLWIMNDDVTNEATKTILGESGNSRLTIRISKAMPALLQQFLGRQINGRLFADAANVISYWFRNTILPMNYTVDAYRIIIDDTNNTPEDARANRMNVDILVRHFRSLKFVNVVHYVFDAGMDLTTAQ